MRLFSHDYTHGVWVHCSTIRLSHFAEKQMIAEEKASFNRGHNGIDVPDDKCLFLLFCNCNFRHYSIHIRIEEPNPIYPNGVRTPTQKSTPHFKNYSVCYEKCMHDAIERLMSTRASLEFSHTARFWFCSVFNYISTRKKHIPMKLNALMNHTKWHSLAVWRLKNARTHQIHTDNQPNGMMGIISLPFCVKKKLFF